MSVTRTPCHGCGGWGRDKPKAWTAIRGREYEAFLCADCRIVVRSLGLIEEDEDDA